MNNNSKSKFNFKSIIIGILVINIFIGFQALLAKDNLKNEYISSIESSGTVTVDETTPYGWLFGLHDNFHDELDYFEWSIVTSYGPGLTFYMMNLTEYTYVNALQKPWRTPGNFSYTELLSDEESSASGTFYPLYSDQWYFIVIMHYTNALCQVSFTDTWMDDFITVDEPTSSGSWKENTSQYINWTWGGDFPNVNVDLYHDGTFLSNIATDAQNNGSYPWKIPTGLSLFDDLYQVNISNSDFVGTWDISDAYFEIEEIRTINVINPSSSDSWEVGSMHSLTWTSIGSITDVKVELFKDGALDSEIISSTANDGTFAWTIPAGLENSTQYQIKITDVSDSLVYDISDYFEIYVYDTITVISPNSLSSWEVGSMHSLTWTSTGSITDVKVELFKGGVLDSEIISSIANDGEYIWNIPSGLYNSTEYQIKITDVSNSIVNNFGDYFEIYVYDTITITSPNSLSSWEVGSMHSLTWTSTGSITDVKVELFKGGLLDSEIISSTANDGEYIWTIPSGLNNSTEYQIKITDVSNSIVNNFGDYFEIYVYNTITITSPNSLSSWEIGTTHSVTWTSTGSITDVRIELFKGGLLDSEIISSTPNDGDFAWTIPSNFDNPAQYQVKITDVSDSLVNHYSDYFEIYVFNTITVTSPDSLSSWEVETTNFITWTSTGSITDVKVELFKDGELELEINSSTPNDGSFSWTIPSGLDNSTQYQIKITDVSNSLVYDISDYFEIYTPSIPSELINIPGYDLMILLGLSIASVIGVSAKVVFSMRKKKRISVGI